MYIYIYTGIHKRIYETIGQDVSLLKAIIKPSILRNFFALFINNFLISSYDLLCEGSDLLPNCSHRLYWEILKKEGL